MVAARLKLLCVRMSLRSVLRASFSISLLAAIFGLGPFSGPVRAQSYPAKTVRFIIPAPPGSTVDIMPRVIGVELAKRLNISVVVDNKAGGAGMIAAQSLTMAPADGGSILIATLGMMCIAPHVLPSIPFDRTADLIPVSLIGTVPLILVINPKMPVRTVREFVAWLNANPHKGTYGSSGASSTPAIAAVMFGQLANLKLTHVAYRGMLPASESVMKGELDFLFSDVGIVASKIKEGALIPLAATTSKRSALVPDVPTLMESGYQVDMPLWYGAFMKAGTPASVVEQMTRELRSISTMPEIRERWKDLGVEPGTMHGQEFADFYQSEVKRWDKIIPPLGIKE